MKPDINRYLLYIFLFFFFIISSANSQTAPDTIPIADTAAPAVLSPTPVTSDDVENFFADTIIPADVPFVPSSPAVEKVEVKKEEDHSVIVMEFVKEKTAHNPDSIFFNVLKITNKNAMPVQGVVRITVPIGWKLISEDEVAVNISPDSSEYIPMRVALSRSATGGITYLVNATLSSNRTLFPNKNQTSVSKACYITIPKNRKWEIMPAKRTIYFNRYTEYALLQFRIMNKGNGNENVKIELNIGSSLAMYGALGKTHFTSIELKPYGDTLLSFPIKYLSPDESDLWSRDFRKFMIAITATADTLIRRTAVNFKYLESTFNNSSRDRLSPLNIEVQVQNLLASVSPRILFGANGNIYFKNDHALDYYLRLPGILFSGYNRTGTFSGDALWQYSRFRARYKAGRWEVLAGDIGNFGMGMIGIGGRGIGGSYRINKNHKIGGTFIGRVSSSVYSGSIQHETTLFQKIKLASALTLIADNYNKTNNAGFTVQSGYSFFKGHFLTVMLAATQTRHLYDNKSFLDPKGNFINTNDPGATFYGVGAQLGYAVRVKKLRMNMNTLYASKHFSQFQNGRLRTYGTGTYTINDKYQLIGGVNFNTIDPQIYNRGVLYPERKWTTGRYSMEFANKLYSKLILFAGPVFDHSNRQQLKIITSGDSVYTRFSTISPKLSFRLTFRNKTYSSVSPYMLMGYTLVTSAVDSTLGSPSPVSENSYYNTNVGVNIAQKLWGINVAYFSGPYSTVTQSDYYYFGSFSKSLRLMPYFQKYYFNKTLLISSYNSYYYQVNSNVERIALNLRLSCFLNHGWTFFADNGLSMFSRVDSEGQKAYSRVYSLSLGFRKSFDIPQPGVKYYDLKVICFKDINGNGVMDSNEQGISDIIITIDREFKTDSITKKSIKPRGNFTPADMVTDVFGQVAYYHIPEGEFNVNVFPLINLADVFNIRGQKQYITISGDTTYYIPFVQSYRVEGRVILERDEYSSAGSVSTANIRITAIDSLNNSFPTLTSGDGSYMLYVPQAGEYKVIINNVFGDQFTLLEPEYTVSFDGAKEFHVDFIFNEKKRAMNVNNMNLPPSRLVNTITSTSAATIPPVNPALSDAGVSYRIQISSSSTRLSQTQRAKMFKGIDNMQEYIEGGVYKYTAGDFKTIEEAQQFKEQLRLKGYKDSFVVPFKDNKRVVNIPTTTTNPANTTGAIKDTSSYINPSPANEGVSYRIQIASRSSQLSAAEQAKLFKGVDNINEYMDGSVYKYTAGEFSAWEYENATEYKDKLIAMGFKGAFIVFFKGGKRVK